MILLDIDGVCLDMLNAIKARNPAFIPEKVLNYSFSKGDFGIPRNEVFKYLSEKETFSLQKPYMGTEQGIEALKALGRNVLSYTSVPDSCRDTRLSQLSDLKIEGLVFNGTKPLILGISAIIDDNPAELLKFKPLRIPLLLFDNFYNQEKHNQEYDFTEFIRVKCLEEAARELSRLL